METKHLRISHNQYFKDIIPQLETNSIYFKTLPNIGITTLEIETPRNSIIIEPNVPVIKGKRKKGMLSIYEGIGVDRVIEYLLSKVKYKKILVTPESFFKVKEAAAFLKIDIHNEFFLFYDECDRTIKDSGFRKDITLPMVDFFKFSNKAFASATALDPSDPRFIEQNFKKVIVSPDFSYQKDIELVTTNNVFLSLQKVLNENPSENYCIFLNSTKLIGSYIKNLNLYSNSSIFCSKDTGYVLKLGGFKNVSDSLGNFSAYNFFTSRFYSAVDVYMDVKPTIIMVTDLVAANHTMIDPYTDAVQIVGRFRKGFEKIIHISNLNTEIKAMNKEEVFAYLSGCEMTYNQIKALRKSATNKGAIDTLDEVLKLIPYAKYLNLDGSKNYYMRDNTLHEEKIKGCYSTEESLVGAYKSDHFNPKHLVEDYPLNDEGNHNLSSGISLLTIVMEVIDALNKIYLDSSLYTIDNRITVLNELNKSFPLIVEAYKELGPDGLERNGYSFRQIRKALAKKRQSKEKSNFEFLKTLHEEFKKGQTFSSRDIKFMLHNIINEHKLTLKPNIKLLSEYFELSPRKTIKRRDGAEIKGFTIINEKFNN